MIQQILTGLLALLAIVFILIPALAAVGYIYAGVCRRLGIHNTDNEFWEYVVMGAMILMIIFVVVCIIEMAQIIGAELIEINDQIKIE